MTDHQLLIHAYGDSPAAELESETSIHVVIQGPAVRELAGDGSVCAEIDDSLVDPRVVVLAGQNSLRSVGLAPPDLRHGVHSVASAVASLARRPWDGSAYLRIQSAQCQVGCQQRCAMIDPAGDGDRPLHFSKGSR